MMKFDGNINRQLLKRSDSPRPDWSRDRWLPLDGEWEFREDGFNIGRINRWCDTRAFDKTIHVPFCVESEASGIANRNPGRVVWYKKRFRLDPEFSRGRRVLLNFGAVDYEARVWLNGHLIGGHEGGYTPFRFDITEALSKSENVLAVRVYDSHDPRIPRGKQTMIHRPFSIFYTTVTGIWQPVWLESAGAEFLSSARINPDPETGKVAAELLWAGDAPPSKVRITVSTPGGKSFTRDFPTDSKSNEKKIDVEFGVPDIDAWSTDNPALYPMRIELLNSRGRTVDAVDTYFAFRTIEIKDGGILLNGKPLYQKLLLDQGFFPAGHYTPTDPAMFRADVGLAKEMGFNGVRKHQKIEDPRFLFWCDALGLLVWEEMPSAFLWSAKMRGALRAQWREAIERDRNHPCVIAWVPFNESWGVNNLVFMPSARKFVEEMYLFTKEMDPTRPVVDNSGFEHVRTDILDLHHYLGTAEKADAYYEQLRDPKKMEFGYSNLMKRIVPSEDAASPLAPGAKYSGEPMIVSEYGGFGFYKTQEKSLIDNFREYTLGIARCDLFQGYAYTQFYDTEQEQNGLLTFDRAPKMPLAEIRAVNDEAEKIAAGHRDAAKGKKE